MHLFIPNSNALGYNLSMKGIGTVAIDGPRFEEFWTSRKEFFEVSQGGLARTLLLIGLHSLVNYTISFYVDAAMMAIVWRLIYTYERLTGCRTSGASQCGGEGFMLAAGGDADPQPGPPTKPPGCSKPMKNCGALSLGEKWVFCRRNLKLWYKDTVFTLTRSRSFRASLK